MPTYIPKVDERDRQWFVIDAKDQVLGKLATRAATILTGKHKPTLHARSSTPAITSS